MKKNIKILLFLTFFCNCLSNNSIKKPDNLILIYSNPKLNKPLEKLPKYFDKTFNNVTTDSQEINCDGKCQECMMCYTLGNKTQTIIEKAK